jgi:hypothetical protein
MQIRRAQMETLHAGRIHRFEDETMRHLESLFPARVAAIPADELREIVRLGIRQSFSYGITREFDVRHYLELMFKLSFDFDRNPLTPWAKGILENKDLPPDGKLARLDTCVLLSKG